MDAELYDPQHGSAATKLPPSSVRIWVLSCVASCRCTAGPLTMASLGSEASLGIKHSSRRRLALVRREPEQPRLDPAPHGHLFAAGEPPSVRRQEAEEQLGRPDVADGGVETRGLRSRCVNGHFASPLWLKGFRFCNGHRCPGTVAARRQRLRPAGRRRLPRRARRPMRPSVRCRCRLPCSGRASPRSR